MYLKTLFKHIGKNVNIQPRIKIEGWHNISTGNNSGIGRNCHISALSAVTIGDNLMIVEDLIIKTTNHTISTLKT